MTTEFFFAIVFQLERKDVNELDFYRPWVLPRHLKHVFCGAVRALVAFLAKKPKLQLL